MGAAITDRILPIGSKTVGWKIPADTVECFGAFFPCVHGFESGKLIKLHCFAAPDLKGTIKVISPAIDEETAKRVIGAARHRELDKRAALGVIASVSNPGFSGSSYELALAITDKLARYGEAAEYRCIIATGCLPHDGCGTVEKIEHLATKIRVVSREAPSGSLFVFPDANFDDLTPVERALLNQINTQGIEWCSITDIDELAGVVWQANQDRLPGYSNSRGRLLLGRKVRSSGLQFAGWVISILSVVMLALFGVMNAPTITVRTVEDDISSASDTAKHVVTVQPPTPAHTESKTEPTAKAQPGPGVRRLESKFVDTKPY